MMKSISYQGTPVHYTVEGTGEALLFLHGYLESLEIWDAFSKRFTNRYKVVRMDIPGHGKSGVLGPVHEMHEMARAASAVLDAEQIDRVVVFGHSMGGYVTMEFVHLFPGRTRGYGLFHSTCFADNDEKKQNRDREISLVMCGKKMQIIRTNIPKGFADDNLERLEKEVERAKQIALAASDEGVVALLQGMKQREDHSETLKRLTPPPLIIWGKKDNYIGEPVFEKLLALAPHASVVVLKTSGHMGFLEEPDCAYAGIVNYLNGLETE